MDNVLPLDPTQDLIFPPELLVSKPCVLVVAKRKVNISGHYFFYFIFLFAFYPFFPTDYGKEKSRTTLFPGRKGQVDFPSRSERFNQAESWIFQCTSVGWEHNHRLVSRGSASIHPSSQPSIHPSKLFLFFYRAKDESEGNCPSFGDLWWKYSRTSNYQMEKQW